METTRANAAVGSLDFILQERVNHAEIFRGYVNWIWVLGRSARALLSRRESRGGVLLSRWVYLVHRAVREHETHCMGVGFRGMTLAWWEGDTSGPEACCGKKRGATEGFAVGFSDCGSPVASGCLSAAGVLALAFGGRKKVLTFTKSLLCTRHHLISFCRSENGSTERFTNMSTVTQLGSGRTREASSTSHSPTP